VSANSKSFVLQGCVFVTKQFLHVQNDHFLEETCAFVVQERRDNVQEKVANASKVLQSKLRQSLKNQFLQFKL
jgi:hypothetical protein